MSTLDRYSMPQIVLHWLIAVIIIGEWISSDGMGRALHARLEGNTVWTEGATPHVWLGCIVFALILVRILLRWRQGAPAPVEESSALMATAAKLGHLLLYALMVAVPIFGMLAWFGGIHVAGEVHETVGNALLFVALGHAAFAIWHHFIKRDGVLNRMRLSSGR